MATAMSHLDAADAAARDVVTDVLDALSACLESLHSYTFPDESVTHGSILVSIESADAQAIEHELASAIERLTGDPIARFADAVHAKAIAAAVQFCERRSSSLFTDSNNPVAGTEASKCATGIRRLADRAVLAQRPELTQEVIDA